MAQNVKSVVASSAYIQIVKKWIELNILEYKFLNREDS